MPGFLGSGKTTLLNHILTGSHGKKIGERKKHPNSEANQDPGRAENRAHSILPYLVLLCAYPHAAVIENEFGEIGIDDALVKQK